jgi:cytochrome c5
LFAAGAAATCLSASERSFLVPQEAACVTGGVPTTAPVYNGVVGSILNASCASCHSDVQQFGAPSFFRLDQFETRHQVLGAGDMAGCTCVSTAQAMPDSPLRMPFQPLWSPLCDSDRETLRRWADRGAPQKASDATTGGGSCLAAADLCVTKGTAIAAPTYADVAPIIAGRCNTCHSSTRCFTSTPQSHFRLDAETVERVYCLGDGGVLDGGVCGDGSPALAERGVGLFEYRGEVVRTAVHGVGAGPTPFNPVGQMPYRPPYAGNPTDLVPPLCQSDRDTLVNWANAGRRSGSTASLPAECINETVPERPTWRSHVAQVLGARCGLCHGGQNRSRLSPGIRLDAYTTDGGAPGLMDFYDWCSDQIVAGSNAEFIVLFFLTQVAYPIVDGGITVEGKSFPLEDGPCPGGSGSKHVRVHLRIFELVKLLSLDEKPDGDGGFIVAMPCGNSTSPCTEHPRGVPARAVLCDNDRETIYRWIDGGAPFE